MTKISNYTVKNPVADLDSWIGSNGYDSAKTTKNFSAQDVATYVKGQLTPIEGGVLKVTEIDVEVLDTDIATTANSLDPTYTVDPYELVHFVVGGRVYILKVVDVTIGVGENPLTNEDFIILPVNSGNGIDYIELHSTSGVNKVYRIHYTDGSHFDYTVADGNDGADGADGTNGTNGLNATMIVISTTSLPVEVSPTSYDYITATFPATLNLGFIEGMRLRLSNSQSNYMEGVVLGVTSTSVDVNIDYIVGSGTFSQWRIGVAGEKGSVGVYPDLTSELYSDEIHDFNGNSVNQIIGSSASGVTYSIYFKKVGNNVFVTGSITNSSGSSISGSTTLATMSNSAYFKKTGSASQMTASTSAGSQTYNFQGIGTDGTIKSGSSLANGITIVFYGRYTIN